MELPAVFQSGHQGGEGFLFQLINVIGASLHQHDMIQILHIGNGGCETFFVTLLLLFVLKSLYFTSSYFTVLYLVIKYRQIF